MRRGPPPGDRRFRRALLADDPPQAARALLGARLVRDGGDGRPRVGRIVEVEAYGDGSDHASHARHGRTARNATMFGPAGHAYVYLVYGIHHCLNVVTGVDGQAAAVLLRAAEMLDGVDDEAAQPRLASGPGRLAAAFGVTRADDGRDLCDPRSALRLEPAAPDDRPVRVVATPRIGIGYAGAAATRLAWRFVDAASPAVSGARGAPRAG